MMISTDCDTVLKNCFEEAFKTFVKSCESTYFPVDPEEEPTQDKIEFEPASRSVPLAALLPLITRSAHQIINGVPNSYLEVSFPLKFSLLTQTGHFKRESIKSVLYDRLHKLLTTFIIDT